MVDCFTTLKVAYMVTCIKQYYFYICFIPCLFSLTNMATIQHILIHAGVGRVLKQCLCPPQERPYGIVELKPRLFPVSMTHFKIIQLYLLCSSNHRNCIINIIIVYVIRMYICIHTRLIYQRELDLIVYMQTVL